MRTRYVKVVSLIGIAFVLLFSSTHSYAKEKYVTPEEALVGVFVKFMRITDADSISNYLDGLHVSDQFKLKAFEFIAPQKEAFEKAGGIKTIHIKRAADDTEDSAAFIAIVVGGNNTAANFLVSLSKVENSWGISWVESLPSGIPKQFSK